MTTAQVILPYVIQRVESTALLEQVRSLRKAAYGHYIGDVARGFDAPDPRDTSPGSVLLAAVAKADRRVIGTIRLATNVEAQLPVEQSVELPSELTRTPLGEFGRFATARDQPDPMIAMMLMKAAYLVAASMQVRTLVVASRQAMAARYEALGFRDLVPDAWYPLAHVGGLPHRLLTLDLVGIVERYRAMNHPMWAFVYQIDHPDICLLAHSEQYRRGA